jgi:raffinose/stachyose/melibiose transport system substrate-binding protein
MLLYYNATLFEEHGWSLPTTMDELIELSEEIDAEGFIPFAHGNQEWRPANHWYLGEFLNHVAGPDKVYDFLMGEAQLTDPEFVRAVDLTTEMQENGWWMGGLENYYTTGSNEFNAALGDGDAAMSINGTWFMSEVGDFFGEDAGNSNDWGWIPVPSESGETVFDIGIGATYSINANSEHPEAVAEYLNYQFSPEVQARLLTQCGIAPAPVDMEGQDLEGVDPRQAEANNALNEAAAQGDYGYLMWTFFSPKTDSYLTENIERVWAGDMSSTELLERAQEIHDEDVAEGLLPPVPQRADEPIEVVDVGTPEATPAQ